MRVSSVLMCYFVLFVLVACFFGVCFDYALSSIVGKDAPFLVDCLAGIVTSAITVPVAVVCLVLSYCGVSLALFTC